MKYNNSIIYEIKCRDKTCKFIYVGGTTSFTKIKHYYKKSYYDNKSTKLNEKIKLNGGWDNWEINILERCDECSSKDDLNKQVKKWEKIKNDSIDKNTEYKCKHCMKIFSRSDALKRHIESRCKVIAEKKQIDKQMIIIDHQNKVIQDLYSIIKNS